jgi:hypothetical protein
VAAEPLITSMRSMSFGLICAKGLTCTLSPRCERKSTAFAVGVALLRMRTPSM